MPCLIIIGEGDVDFPSKAQRAGFTAPTRALTVSKLEAAMADYAYFGFDDVVTILREATAIEFPWEESQEAASLDFDARYAAAIPTDVVIAERCEIRLTTHPHDFAPIDQRPISPA